jgi:aconitate hydratase
VVAQSFERIHRSNLVFMGVLPCQFTDGASAQSLGIDGTETFELTGLEGAIKPRQVVELTIRKASGEERKVSVLARIDTPIEVDYYRHGGILPYVLRQLLGGVS